MDIGDAVRTGGVYDVCVVGNLIAVRDGSGLIQRCPECYRVIQKGSVEPTARSTESTTCA